MLMLAILGLERLESGLDDGAVSASDVAAFLEQAQADDVHTLARDGMPTALDGMQRRLQGRVAEAPVARPLSTEEDWLQLPTPQYQYNREIPGFQQYRHADRV
ncbi:hypothetical protein [Mycobacterium sp. 1274761.0]|uniref:hypothetical protein n=1 Tax=Mycobacterium sp. 1274761.0 TaxID=1834077 RepID=UPI0009ED956C|nr:hypothetical protein [Mycobacterium sp. 1274761.0]